MFQNLLPPDPTMITAELTIHDKGISENLSHVLLHFAPATIACLLQTQEFQYIESLMPSVDQRAFQQQYPPQTFSRGLLGTLYTMEYICDLSCKKSSNNPIRDPIFPLETAYLRPITKSELTELYSVYLYRQINLNHRQDHISYKSDQMSTSNINILSPILHVKDRIDTPVTSENETKGVNHMACMKSVDQNKEHDFSFIETFDADRTEEELGYYYALVTSPNICTACDAGEAFALLVQLEIEEQPETGEVDSACLYENKLVQPYQKCRLRERCVWRSCLNPVWAHNKTSQKMCLYHSMLKKFMKSDKSFSNSDIQRYLPIKSKNKNQETESFGLERGLICDSPRQIASSNANLLLPHVPEFNLKFDSIIKSSMLLQELSDGKLAQTVESFCESIAQESRTRYIWKFLYLSISISLE